MRYILSCFLLLFMLGIIRGDETVHLLSLEEAVSYALKHDSALAEKRSLVLLRETEAMEYKDLQDPQLRLETDDDWETRVALRFFLPHMWGNTARQRRGQAAVEAERVLVQRRKWDVEAAIYSYYVRIFFLEQDLHLQKALIELHKSRKEHVQEKIKEYLATEAELLSLQADLIDKKWHYSRSNREKESLMNDLLQATGLQNEDPELSYPSWLEEGKQYDWDEEKILSFIQEKHTDIEYLDWLKRELIFTRQEYKSENIPWPDYIQGSVSSRDSSFPDDTWAVQVGISLPIFSRRHTKHVLVDERISHIQQKRDNMLRDKHSEMRAHLRKLARLQEELEEYTSYWNDYSSKMDEYLQDPLTREQLDFLEYVQLQKRALRSQRSVLYLQKEIMETVLLIREKAGYPILFP